MKDEIINHAISSLYQYLTVSKRYDLSGILIFINRQNAVVIVKHANIRPIKPVKKYILMIRQYVISLNKIHVYFINDVNLSTSKTQLVVLNDSAKHRKLCLSPSPVLSKTLQGIDSISYINTEELKLLPHGYITKVKDPCTKQKIYIRIN